MKLIDLTLPLSEKTPLFHGDPPIRLHKRKKFKKHGFNQTDMSCTVHAGTHMDAPSHFCEHRKSIDQIPLAWCMGDAICIDVREKKEIGPEVLPKKFAHAVLFYTGWSENTQRLDYCTKYPVLTFPLIKILMKNSVRIIGVDTPSPEHSPYKCHTALNKKNRLILENLGNLKKVAGKRFTLIAFPIALKGSDGSPIRAVAILP